MAAEKCRERECCNESAGRGLRKHSFGEPDVVEIDPVKARITHHHVQTNAKFGTDQGMSFPQSGKIGDGDIREGTRGDPSASKDICIRECWITIGGQRKNNVRHMATDGAA